MYAEIPKIAAKKFDSDSDKKRFMKYIRSGGAEETVLIRYDSLVKHPLLSVSLDGVRELADSIEYKGLKKPLTVVKKGDSYAVLCGYKRYLAIGMLRKKGSTSFESVPCVIRNFEDESMEKKYMAFDNLFLAEHGE